MPLPVFLTLKFSHCQLRWPQIVSCNSKEFAVSWCFLSNFCILSCRYLFCCVCHAFIYLPWSFILYSVNFLVHFFCPWHDMSLFQIPPNSRSHSMPFQVPNVVAHNGTNAFLPVFPCLYCNIGEEGSTSSPARYHIYPRV